MTVSNMKSSDSIADSATQGGDYQATMNINASPNAVFGALTTTSAISDWWVTASGGGNTGDELIIHFGDSPLICHVDEAERPAHVRWTALDCDLEPDWVGTEIIFDLRPALDGGTHLDFCHHGLTPQLECFEMCQSGWIQALGGLLRYLEAGDGKPSGSEAN